MAKEVRFDLIILDVNLPDANAFEICKELRRRHLTRLTPIVHVSEQYNIEDWQRSLKAGATDYIANPLSREFAPRLLAHIENSAMANKEECLI